MGNIVISVDVKDYDKCLGQTLRNRGGFVIGVIVDIAVYTNEYRSRIFFKLDNGSNVFADTTDFCKFKQQVISNETISRKADGNSLLWSSGLMNRNVNNYGIENSIDDDDIELDKYDSSIGKSIYRDGTYVGIIVSKEYDAFGAYYAVSNNSKIRIELQGEDELIDISLMEGEEEKYVTVFEDDFINVESIENGDDY